MNERIQKLAVQAGEYVNSVYTPPVRSKTPGKIWEDGHIGWHEQFNQKFAELIVKECISRIEGCAVETSPDDFVKGYNKGVSKVSSQVKQHFGVEE